MTPDSLPRFGIFKTEARVIQSRYVEQAYDLGIWLPFSYTSSDRRYPVLYVLDGEFLFPMAAGLMPTLVGSGEAPEMIVVGIAYHGIADWPEFGDLRERDYLPQPMQEPGRVSRQAQYIDFFQKELFPLIESAYRADPAERALFGFSGSGFFALDMLFNQPGMFRRHIAASCTWPGADAYFVDCARKYASPPNRPPVSLYLSAGGQEKDFLPGFSRVVVELQHLRNVRLFHEAHGGEGHSAGNMAKAFLNGVKAIFG